MGVNIRKPIKIGLEVSWKLRIWMGLLCFVGRCRLFLNYIATKQLEVV